MENPKGEFYDPLVYPEGAGVFGSKAQRAVLTFSKNNSARNVLLFTFSSNVKTFWIAY